jgi:peptidoglycan/LPS O-acetylase OafA/YrhL
MQRLVALDGLRGMAAIAVVAGHALRDFQTPFFQPSYLAVDFFFVLSGFVLARTYEARFAGGLSFLDYMRRRVRRLYPAILVGLALGLAVALAHGANDQVWIAAVLQAMMLPRFAGAMFPFNDVQWSLMFELFANAVHALIHRWLTHAMLGLIVLASMIALWTLSLRHGTMNGGFDVPTLHLGFARVLFSFFAGVAIYRLASLPRLGTPSLSFLGAACVLSLALAIPAGPVPAVVADLVITTLVWPALVFLVVKSPQQPVRLRAFAEWSGRISYPLYAVHFPVVLLFEPWTASAAPMAERLVAVPLIVGLSLVLAALVERYVERPVLTRGARLRPSPSPAG